MVACSARLLITGATGFVGTHLVDDFRSTYRIFAVARGQAELARAPAHRNIEWLQADVADPRHAAALLERIQAAGGIDFVIHLAGYYDFTGDDAPEYQNTNVEGLRNILDISRKLKPRRFIFSSSVAACDFTRSGQVIFEDTPPEGRSCYARSKRLGERMLLEYAGYFPCCVVRLAALFSDWCEYEPLYSFLSGWLSPGWRNRILAGRGESAVPYLHIRDAVAFFARLLECDEQLESVETLTASPDGATSHRGLYAVATACHFGQRRRPILMPGFVCRAGLRGLDVLGRLTGRRSFERPWMGRCIDQKLHVDARLTRAKLEWAPTERLGILRRMPFLIQNRKAYPDQWLQRNHAAARWVRHRNNARIAAMLAVHEERICSRFSEFLRDPANRGRFPGYLDCTPTQLQDRHHLIVGQLMCAIRTGDKGVFMNCCRHLAERWLGQGLPLEELWEALDCLGRTCVSTLSGLPESKGLEQALFDHISMTFQFAVDAVHEVHERQTLAPV